MACIFRAALIVLNVKTSRESVAQCGAVQPSSRSFHSRHLPSSTRSCLQKLCLTYTCPRSLSIHTSSISLLIHFNYSAHLKINFVMTSIETTTTPPIPPEIGTRDKSVEWYTPTLEEYFRSSKRSIRELQSYRTRFVSFRIS